MTEQRTPARKKAGVAAVALAGLVAAGSGGAALHALFTDTQEMQGATFTSGTIRLDPDTKSGVANAEFTQGVENLAAGDTTYRFFTMKNAGSIDYGKIEATVTTTGDLAGAGKAGLPQVKQVNGEDSVGAGDTPLEIGLIACVNGQWSQTVETVTNPDGTTYQQPKPSCNGTEQALTTDFTVDAGTRDGADATAKPYLTHMAKATAFTQGKNVLLYNKLAPGYDATQATADENVIPDALVGPGDEVSYMVVYHLPKDAKNEYQDTDATMDFKITATQREGRSFDATAKATS